MDRKIYDKIDEIFDKRKDKDGYFELQKQVEFNCKKAYNQMLQSGFSEYIAVAESLDLLNKIEKIIETENDMETVKALINSKEKTLKENIKKTAAENINENGADNDSLEKIIELVNDAALAEENLANTAIEEQNDEIIYKDKPQDNKKDSRKPAGFTKKEVLNYLKQLGSFIVIIGVTTAVLVLLHYFKVF